MARADYVYMVLDTSGGTTKPVAGFTVKHELITWLKKQTETTIDSLEVWRCNDNPCMGEQPARMKLKLLLPPDEPEDKPCEGFQWVGGSVV